MDSIAILLCDEKATWIFCYTFKDNEIRENTFLLGKYLSR